MSNTHEPWMDTNFDDARKEMADDKAKTTRISWGGLTLEEKREQDRLFLAGQALAGLIQSRDIYRYPNQDEANEIGKFAAMYADATLAALARPQAEPASLAARKEDK